MKKAGLFVASILLISLFSFVLSVSAEETAPGLGEAPLVNEVQAGQQTYEQYTAAQNKSDYLKQEWVKMAENNKVLGPITKVLNSVLQFLNPFFKIVLGYESSLSWAFIFAILIWIILFFFIMPILSQLLNNGLLGALASFAVVSLIGLSGTIKMAVDVINGFVNNKWVFWISLGVIIILVFISEKAGKSVKGKLKKMKEESAEVETEEAQKTIQTRAESAKKELEK